MFHHKYGIADAYVTYHKYGIAGAVLSAGFLS